MYIIVLWNYNQYTDYDVMCNGCCSLVIWAIAPIEHDLLIRSSCYYCQAFTHNSFSCYYLKFIHLNIIASNSNFSDQMSYVLKEWHLFLNCKKTNVFKQIRQNVTKSASLMRFEWTLVTKQHRIIAIFLFSKKCWRESWMDFVEHTGYTGSYELIGS